MNHEDQQKKLKTSNATCDDLHKYVSALDFGKDVTLIVQLQTCAEMRRVVMR